VAASLSQLDRSAKLMAQRHEVSVDKEEGGRVRWVIGARDALSPTAADGGRIEQQRHDHDEAGA
jgi:hypothetical protein